MTFYEFSIAEAKYAICFSKKDFKKFCKSIGIGKREKSPFVNEWADATTHFFDTSAGLRIVVCLGDTNGVEVYKVAGLIAHECVHVWQSIEEWMRESSPGGEVEAYSIQSIFVNLFSDWAEHSGRTE